MTMDYFSTSKIVSGLFSLALIKIPLLLIKSIIPKAPSLISFTHLYLFMQALGVLWLLFVSAVSVAATRLGSLADLSSSIPQQALLLWVHIAILNVGIGIGKSLWSKGWETFADFPTCKALLNPKSALTISTRSAQIALLMCPLVVFGVIGTLQLFMPLGEGAQENEGRLNRMVRLTVWVGLLQWAQIFHFIFPNWSICLNSFSRNRRIILNCIFLILIPSSLLRILHWVSSRAGDLDRSVQSSIMKFDCVLMVAWAGVMHSIASSILGSKERLALAGWRKDAFTNSEIWTEGSILMKFGFVFACLVQFFRSFLNPNRGFSYAQNDLLVLTVAYPLLMVVTWFATQSTLALRKRKYSSLVVVLLGPLSFIICRLARIQALGAVAGVWIYLIKTFVRRTPAVMTAPSQDKKIPTVSSVIGHKIAEKDFASKILKITVPLTYFYGLILLVLSLLALLQQTTGSNVGGSNGDLLTVFKPNNSTISVRHAVSQIDLYPDSLSPIAEHTHESFPIYGICNNKLWGLEVVDYGLFSMLSYAGNSETIRKAVSHLFPDPKYTVEVIKAKENNQQFWTEFNVNNQTTVIAVRGSEYWRISDYLEDLRMWTEPVAKSLLTLVFPTVRAWSPKTTAMVFDAYQEFLAFIGLPDDQEYKYQKLLEYINTREFPSGQNVVLTGHSLGGGIASITGTIARLPTVTFLSPGMYQAASKFFFHSSKSHRQIVEMVHNQSVSIQVENDFVGKYLDSHAGLVQTITCSVDHLAPLTCHLIDNSVCNLIRHCRDPRWPGGCEFKYDFNIFLNATFPPDTNTAFRSFILEPLTNFLNQWFSDYTPKQLNQEFNKHEL